MLSPEYYRRQSELCLQLALLHHDTHTTYRLVELAKEMQARAEEAEGAEGETERQHSQVPPYILGEDKLADDGGIDHD